jgi:SET domain-containing protein
MSVPRVYVAQSPERGRGVFAAEDIAEGTMIEECPVIVVPGAEAEDLMRTALRDYRFLWGPLGDDSAIALGNGSLYNHSNAPNALYVKKFQQRVIEFVAIADIAKDEEITVSYNGGIGDRSPVWFEVR